MAAIIVTRVLLKLEIEQRGDVDVLVGIVHWSVMLSVRVWISQLALGGRTSLNVQIY